MEPQRYRVVLKGELMEGYNRAEAIQSLATLFGQPPEKLGNVFSGRPIPLKQELELPRAQQIQARLHSIGVKCSLEPVAPPPVAFELLLDEPAPPPPPAKSKMQMSCPKCGKAQEIADVCGACGLVVAKWKDPKAEEKASPREEGGKPHYWLNEDQLLHLFIDSNADKYLEKFQNFKASQGFAVTWHWPALFVPFLWALYRKMWGWSAVIFVSMFIPFSFIVWPLTANYIYYRHAQGALARLGKQPDEGSVARAGGTSAKAVLVALGGVVLAGFLVSGVFMKKGFEAAAQYAEASEKAMPEVPDSAEGRQTMAVLQTSAFVVNMWAGGGKDVGTVSLDALISDLQLPEDRFVDGWGNPVRISPTPDNFMVVSAGPDGLFGSTDDIRFEPPPLLP